MHNLNHNPFGPYPRNTFAGEQAYFNEWKEIADEVFLEILDWGGSLDEVRYQIQMELDWVDREQLNRQCRLVSSFMCWLGTNCGCGFLSAAKEYEEKLGRHGPTAYLAAWATENKRSRGVNGGLRTLEHLCRGEMILTAVDYEIVENAARWLGSKDGKLFCERAEKRVAVEQEKIDMYEILKL
ncbi:MAG TPA: hypothetical protein VFM18_18045 [Methanosarcina sp.]|nr:hypothetical protein [Methanosarcina sp.]